MSERRRSFTPATLRARGRHALPWLRRNWANRWKVLLAPTILGATLFAYPALAGNNFYVATTGSDANDCTSAETPCLTIAGAIAKAQAGDTVVVAAGTYNEDAIVISKALTLQGAGAATTSIDKSADPAGVTIIDIKDITSGEVVVEGFTIRTGAATSNPTSDLFQNGIGVFNVSNGATVKIRNNKIYGNPSTTKYGAVSPATYYDNFGISANNNPGGTSAALEITGNTLYGGNSNTILIEAWRGPVLVSGNVIHRQVQQTSSSAVVFDMNYGGDATGAHRFEGNTFELGVNPGTNRMDALTVVSAFDAFDSDGLVGGGGVGGFTDVRILNNLIKGFDGNNGRGIILWDSTNAADSAITATITGNTFSGSSSNFGIRLTGPDITSTIHNNSFGAGGMDPGVAKGILAFPFGSLNGPKAALTDVEDNNLGASSLGIDWASGQGTLDASSNYWGTAAGPAGKTSGSVTTAPWIATYTPDPAKSGSPGFWPTSVTYTSQCTTTCYVAKTGSDSNSGTAAFPFLTIQKGLDIVSSGGTVTVGAGSYNEALTISKPVTLRGAKADVPAGPSAAPSGRSTVTPYSGESSIPQTLAVAGGLGGTVTIDGFVIESSGNSINLNAETNAVIVRNCILTGRSFDIQTVGTAAGLTKQTTNSGSSVAYAFEYNWIKGGRYGIALNSGSRVDTVSIRGNYMTGVQRGIQTNETWPNGSGVVTVRANYFSGVTKGIRFAQGGHTVIGNTVDNLFRAAGDSSTVIAALEMDAQAGGHDYGPITVTQNSFSSGDYSVRIDKPVAGQRYTVTDNSLVGAATALALLTPDAGASVVATRNWWGQSSGPGAGQVTAGGATVTTSPFLSAYVAGATSPGFWPATTSLALGEISGPTTVPLAGESLGSPSVEIPGATAGTTIEVSAPTASELPADVTPFKVDGATLIEINVTGTVTFPVTVCLNGVLGTDKLWHYENNDWVDITGRLLPGPGSLNPVDYPAGQICGMTDSFSPFALAEGRSGDPEDCSYDSGTKTLTVPIPSGGTLSVARQGSDLWVGSIDVWCGATAKAIGNTAGKVNILNITGASGDETVTFLNGTATNWGANQTGSTTLKRVIDLGTGTSDRIVIQGTGSGDALAASTFSGFASGVEIYRFEGGAGSDTLTGSAVIDEFIGDAGTDVFKGGTGNDCADYSAQTATISANLTSGSGGNGTIGTDSYSSIECLKGSSDNDVLIGSAYGDWLYGNGGDDTLQGRGGPDALDGGDGTDTVSYTEQTYPVVVNLTAGTATGSTVGTGGDTIALGTVENVLGGSAGDTLVGNASANSLDGGAGADTLVGMAGGDTLNGNTGLDTVSYDNSVGAFGAGAASTVVIANLTTGVASGGGGADTFTAIENLTGSSYNDDLTGSSAVNIINGLDGNDTVNAGEGNDTVNGGGGADTLNGDAGADTLKGGDDVDILNGGAGADPLWGEGDNDTLCGGSEGDTLRGGDGDDTLVGGTGGTGVDIMYGDGGTGDTISYHVGDCSDAETGAITFKLGAVGTQQNTGGAGTDVNGGGVENLRGGSGNDTLVGDAYANIIEGLGGNDTMQGGSGDDTIYSGSGTSNKADGQLGTDTCTISDGGAWATTPNCEVKLP